MIFDVDGRTRDRLAVSAAEYAVGRRTYVTGCVSDVLIGNAGRFSPDANTELRRILDAPATALGPIDLPCWHRALRALETAVPDATAGIDGSDTDLRVLLFCAFRHDMGGDNADIWPRLLADPPELLDASWRAISARDLYEAGYAPQGAPEPPIQHLEPYERHDDSAWADVYLKLVRGRR